MPFPDASFDVPGITPVVVPNGQFYKIDTAFFPPAIDVATWNLRVFGMVNSAPGFSAQPSVINGFSDLILELYGPERGAHSRSAE